MTITIDPTWETFIVRFGKHASKSLAQIYQEEPGYVKWLSEDSFMEDVKIAAQYVVAGKPIPLPKAPEPIDSALGDFMLTFGKYEGSTMGNIWLKEPSYIKWLARESYMADVRKNAQAIVNNDPQEIEQLKEKEINKKYRDPFDFDPGNFEDLDET